MEECLNMQSKVLAPPCKTKQPNNSTFFVIWRGIAQNTEGRTKKNSLERSGVQIQESLPPGVKMNPPGKERRKRYLNDKDREI